MSFNFNAPPPAATAAAIPSAAAPLTAVQALQGFGTAEIDLRDPFPPVGMSALVELIGTEGKSTRQAGFGIYIRAKVIAVASPGGGACPKIKGNNPIPASVGTVYTLPIRGFDKPDARKFAMSDLKLALIAILESKGLTQANAGAVPEAEWERMAAAVAAGQLGMEGTQFAISTSEVGKPDSPFAKLKVLFYPKSMVSAPA
jgi:hypothetical protein